jgi:hypothetical protein
MIARIDLVGWEGANWKERVLCNIFTTYLNFVSHDEAITVLLSLLADAIENDDEIDTMIEQITTMRGKPR